MLLVVALRAIVAEADRRTPDCRGSKARNSPQLYQRSCVKEIGICQRITRFADGPTFEKNCNILRVFRSGKGDCPLFHSVVLPR